MTHTFVAITSTSIEQKFTKIALSAWVNFRSTGFEDMVFYRPFDAKFSMEKIYKLLMFGSLDRAIWPRKTVIDTISFEVCNKTPWLNIFTWAWNSSHAQISKAYISSVYTVMKLYGAPWGFHVRKCKGTSLGQNKVAIIRSSLWTSTPSPIFLDFFRGGGGCSQTK